MVGARLITYKNAVLLEVACQIVGTVAFGPHFLAPYGGVLKRGTEILDSPELVMYALLCVTFVLPAWHLLAYWQHVPCSPFTELGKSHGSNCHQLPQALCGLPGTPKASTAADCVLQQ